MKPTLRKFGISAICFLSFSAFIFLNTVKTSKDLSSSFGMQPASLEESIERNDDSKVKKLNQYPIPDISIAKRVFILMKKFIPAS